MGDVKVDKMVQAVGNMYSNDKIDLHKGPGTFTGNLWAVEKIDIKKDVTVDGDATSGGEVKLHKDAVVTGSVWENTPVAVLPLAVLSYTEGTDDVKLKKNEALTLPPGSYKKVEADKEAVLTRSLKPAYHFILQICSKICEIGAISSNSH